MGPGGHAADSGATRTHAPPPQHQHQQHSKPLHLEEPVAYNVAGADLKGGGVLGGVAALQQLRGGQQQAAVSR